MYEASGPMDQEAVWTRFEVALEEREVPPFINGVATGTWCEDIAEEAEAESKAAMAAMIDDWESEDDARLMVWIQSVDRQIANLLEEEV